MFDQRNLPSQYLFDKMVYLAIWGTIPWKGKRRWGEFDVQVRRPGTRPRDILIFERRRRPASVRFRSVHRNQWFRRASGRRKSSCWRRTNVGPRLFRNTSPLTAVFGDFLTVVGWTDIKRIQPFNYDSRPNVNFTRNDYQYCFTFLLRITWLVHNFE